MGPWDLILNTLDAKDLCQLAAVNSDMQAVVKSFRMRAFKVECILSKFFSYRQIQEFKDMQERTGTVISGSAALQFFHRVVWPATDLDLYVQAPFAAECTRFIANCGYKIESCREAADCDYSLDSIQSV